VEGPSLDALGADTGMRVLLTDRFCDRAKSTSAQTDYFDESVSGLALRERFRHGTRLLRAPRQGAKAVHHRSDQAEENKPDDAA